MNNPVKYFLYLLFFLLLACQSRYAYRSKVRVGKQETAAHKPESDKHKAPLQELETEEPGDWLTSTADTSTHFVLSVSPIKEAIPNPESTHPGSKVKASAPSELLKKKNVTSERAPLNYYAKWAFMMALITLLIPFLGPLDITLGIIALKQIRKSGERGKGRSVFALILGLIPTAILVAILLIETVIDPYSFSMSLSFILIGVGILLFNFMLFYLIHHSGKNPANKERFQDRKPLDANAKGLFNTTLVIALLMAISSMFLIPLSLSPMVWLLSARTLKIMPKEKKSNRRFLMKVCYVLGVLGTIALVVSLAILLSKGMYAVLFAIILAIFSVVFTLTGLLILAVNSKKRRDSFEEKKGSINGLSKTAFISGLISIASIFLTPLSAFSIIAIVTALNSFHENRVMHEQGSEMATAGLVLGLIMLVIGFLLSAYAYKELWSKLYLLGLLLGIIISPILIKIHRNRKIKRDFQKNGRR